MRRNTSSVRKKRAQRRLAKEYALLQQSPLENCAASPKLNASGDVIDLFTWDVNISSTSPELEGVPFHFVMTFPSNYPDSAPKVKAKTYLAHPNVFGDYICLDILTLSEETKNTPYRGWTNAYTVGAICVQLQSFLFEVAPSQRECERMVREANAYTERHGYFPEIEFQTIDEVREPLDLDQIRRGEQLRVVAQFDFGNREHYSTNDFARLGDRLEIVALKRDGVEVQRWPQPWRKSRKLPLCHLNKVVLVDDTAMDCVSEEEEDEDVTMAGTKEAMDLYYLDLLPEHLFHVLLEFINWEDQTKLSLIAEEIGNSMLKSKRLTMQSYRCFYTLMDAMERDILLGYGVQCKRMNKRSRKTGRKTMCLQQLHVSFDIMSYTAYNDCGVRNNVWKDRPIDGFIPLYINQEHGQKAMRHNRMNLPRLLDGPSAEFTTDTILQIYGKAMNTTVVDMMLSVEDVETGQLQLTDSIKALEGYMALHHTLLAYALQYPQLVDACEEYVSKFINDIHARDKEVVPDIGELLIALSLTDYTWAEFVLAWLEECMNRNCRWVLAKYPNLLTKEHEFSCVRLNQTYSATRTGKRLAMFQRFFIERIASPPNLEGNPQKNKILFEQYNARCGRPPVGLAEELQRHSRQVLACDDWFTFFDLVGFVAPSAENVWKWLHNAAMISESKQYHNESSIMHFSENHLVSPRDQKHCERRNCLCSGQIMKVLPPSQRRQAEDSLIVHKVKQQDKLDVAFCVDTTGSMGSWIRAAKKQVRGTMRNLRESGKRVRFGFVAYKDHMDKEVTNVTDFTQDENECQAVVDEWRASGGGDCPEAVATAFKEVGDLSWDTEATRLCILITDAPPHGLGGDSYDRYPTGPPDGSDVFKNAHTLGCAGVAIYVVYTGYRSDGMTEAVYRGIAERTGGAFLRLSNSNADQLSKIVIASSLEENLLDDLAESVMPYYEQIKNTHGIARREQMEYQLHATCAYNNVTTSSYIVNEDLSPAMQKQVDDFVLCMDLDHCRALAEHEYYSPFPRPSRTFDGEVVKSEEVVTRAQIKKILTRINHQLAVSEIQQRGCRFCRPEWEAEAATTRWNEFASKQPHSVRTVLKKFEPWARLNQRTLSYLAKIPSSGLKVKAIPLTDSYKPKNKDKYLQVQSAKGINIRAEPNKQSERLGKLEDMAVIKVLGQEGHWIQHKLGWSKWSKGAFARHTPERTRPLGRPKPVAQERTFAWKQNDRIKCKRRVTIRGMTINMGDEYVVKSVSRGERGNYMIKQTGGVGRMIGVPNNPYITQAFEILPPEEPKAEATIVTMVIDEKTGRPTPITDQYHVCQKLLCVPYQRLAAGTAGWRLCSVTSIQPFTCVFDHNGKKIKPSLYQHLCFKPAPPAEEKPVVVNATTEPVEAAAGASAVAFEAPAPVVTREEEIVAPPTQPAVSVYSCAAYEGSIEMTPMNPVQWYLSTTPRTVVRAGVHPRSAIVQELPLDTMLCVDCVCQQRAHVTSPVNGWIWLSGPSQKLVTEFVPHVPTAVVAAPPAAPVVSAPPPRTTIPPEYDYHTYANVNEADVEILTPARYYVTSRKCAVRADLNCRSAKLGDFPAESMVRVDRIYKQRARVFWGARGFMANGRDTAPQYGWFWLSSPHGPMVHHKNETVAAPTTRGDPARVHYRPTRV